MTQEYVPHGGVPPPMTPNACLQEGMTRVPIAPTSPPGCHGGMQMGSPPRASPPPPPPPQMQHIGDGSAWSYTKQMHRSSPHAAQAVEAQPLPTSSLEASYLWNQSVNSARQQHNWWLSLAPQDRATHIGLPTSFQALPTQVPVLPSEDIRGVQAGPQLC